MQAYYKSTYKEELQKKERREKTQTKNVGPKHGNPSQFASTNGKI